jgi:single-stranded-DNA-specific exonuclease
MLISPILTEILTNRGIHNIDEYLQPKYESLSDPFLMHDMMSAVQQIAQAIESNTRIAIYSDYDADGIPGATVLTDFFRLIKHDNYCVYIPHRHNEGYGLHAAALDMLKSDAVELVVTCDLGITAAREVAYAQSIGLKVIVTDHHESDGGELPNCLLVHPKLGSYPDPMICGCAVAFQLVRAMIMHMRDNTPDRVAHVPDGYEKWMLDLVGMSTIADMVPLVGENRLLAQYGLRVMRQTRRAGLRALALVSRADLLTCDETTIGFRIVPYINAASRMENPMLAYDLISETEQGVAFERAKYLNSLNTLRQSVVKEIMITADQIAQTQSMNSILWVGSDNWHVGVLSIIAGRVSEGYKKPAFIWTGYGDDLMKGSVRGVDGINVLDIMLRAPDHIFKKRGGHASAGGFTLYREHLVEFIEYLSSIEIDSDPALERASSRADMTLGLSQITQQLVRDLDRMRPFGMGNPRPVFAVTARLVERKVFGKTASHEKLLFADELGNMVWLLLFSGERDAYTHLKIGDIASLRVQIEESGTGRYQEVVMRPAK